eukprot:CAMPEP_0176393982 /NCGR_PEP_ID=MMETSP0126-20121128/42198_1 /TAXON_ID=141414 ORGANISM="Strombidinopsis acuminatum, Strain SPMC142" /NCGR_SAMPLE_ID=MMETSP0126 /ASSEMBLY_ACC=CAM_ASM_000229 /LENGTH=87 /DNA_ID=CAMNT_0017765895 /DNA_START=67 /DNA_END=326 /DNA_ORIENTATION=+
MLKKEIDDKTKNADSSFIGPGEDNKLKAIVDWDNKTVKIIVPENSETGEKQHCLRSKIEIVNAEDLNMSTLDVSAMDNSFIGGNGMV